MLVMDSHAKHTMSTSAALTQPTTSSTAGATVSSSRAKRTSSHLYSSNPSSSATFSSDLDLASTKSLSARSSIVSSSDAGEETKGDDGATKSKRAKVATTAAASSTCASSSSPPSIATSVASTLSSANVKRIHRGIPASAVAAEYRFPPRSQLVQRGAAACSVDRVIMPAVHKSKAEKEREKERKQKTVAGVTPENANYWLLLTAAGAIEQVTVGNIEHQVKSDTLIGSFSVLLGKLKAHPGVKDEQGHSAVHHLIFNSILECSRETLSFKSQLDPSLASFDNGGINPSEDELAPPWLWKLSRYRIEPALEVLLEKSRKYGYRGELTMHWYETDWTLKPNLIDLADQKGNTPLHFAVAWRRVDLVSLLLLHDADVNIKNRAGIRVYDMCEWQKVTNQAASITLKQNLKVFEQSGAATVKLRDPDVEMKEGSDETAGEAAKLRPHPPSSSTDMSIYHSLTHSIERRWGTYEGLRIDQCSYEGESDEAAIKRCIFQQMLYNAVDEGDEGDIKKLRRLMSEWQEVYSSQKYVVRPLVYRADCCFSHPLQVAVSYTSDSTVILSELLQVFPFSFGVQPRKTQYAALPLSAYHNNTKAIDLLVKAGFDPRFRDAANGRSALLAVAHKDTMADLHSLISDTESISARESTSCRITRQLLHLGADPTIIDSTGNNAFMVAVAKGNIGLVSLYLQWAAIDARSLSALSSSPFLQQVNVFGYNSLHYSFYHAYLGSDHFAVLQALICSGAFSDIRWPRSRSGVTPIQLFTAFDGETGKRICKEILKKSVQDVAKMVETQKKWCKRQVIHSDLSNGLERFPVEVTSDYDLTPIDLAALQSFKYITKNHFISPTDPAQCGIAPIDPDALTLSEAMEAAKEEKQKGKGRGRKNDSSTDEDDDDTEAETPSHMRQLLQRGLVCPVQVRMTAKCGWGLFAQKFIPKDVFVLEYIGELLHAPASELRTLEYVRDGTHPIYQFNGLSNIESDRFSLDPRDFGSCARFINHSCKPKLETRSVLDNSRLALYSLCNIQPGEELTMDYKYDAEEIGACFICHCGEKECEHTLL